MLAPPDAQEERFEADHSVLVVKAARESEVAGSTEASCKAFVGATTEQVGGVDGVDDPRSALTWAMKEFKKNWRVECDEYEGERYASFHNRKTKQAQWERPPEVPE